MWTVILSSFPRTHKLRTHPHPATPRRLISPMPKSKGNRADDDDKVTTRMNLRLFGITPRAGFEASGSTVAMLLQGFLIAAVLVAGGECWETSWPGRRRIGIEPGPSVIATRGDVWPKPHTKTTTRGFFIVRANLFQFKVAGATCGRLERAIVRYTQELRAHDKARRARKMLSENDTGRRTLVTDDCFRGYLDELTLDLRSPCEHMPHMDMDEHYELRINTEDFPNETVLISQSIWGILRGLETWSQLVYSSSDNNALLINGTSIMDFPRFSHRGLLIDTARHFLPPRTIHSMLDAMAMSKMNVLHWHIVDDQSFPYQSRLFLELSAKGAYASTHVYTPTIVQTIIDYAADRGIRVIPEFDTPGHTRSWGQAFPHLLTECYFLDKPDGSLGPMNPIKPATYHFVQELLKEVKETFPDEYIHLGGDEVQLECWESNPEISDYMEARNWTTKDLEGMYMNRIVEMARNLSGRSVVWQEVFDDGVILPNGTIVHIWKGGQAEELHRVTRKGYKALLSSCWYLDGLSSGGDWQKFYQCDPQQFPGSRWQRRLVIGGEACMWGEVVDVNNVMSRVWPRACAAAEKLWSPATTKNIRDAERRLEEHTCRMNRRKIPAQPPNGPGFCPDANFA